MYTKEQTELAIRLVARGVAGILPVEEAEKLLNTLPEELQDYVMATAVTVVKIRDMARLMEALANG